MQDLGHFHLDVHQGPLYHTAAAATTFLSYLDAASSSSHWLCLFWAVTISLGISWLGMIFWAVISFWAVTFWAVISWGISWAMVISSLAISSSSGVLQVHCCCPALFASWCPSCRWTCPDPPSTS